MKYPIDNSQLRHFDLTREVKPERLIEDMKLLFGVANGIEDIQNPYDAAEKALRYSKRYGVCNLLAEFDADVQEKTLADPRFLGLEHKVAIAVEKAPKVKLTCCSPGCRNTAIDNSHTLQKGGVLKYLSGDTGKVYQTKITPFTEGEALNELSIKSASTFPGYCKACEISMFSASENEELSLSAMLIYPLLWRALCFIRFRRAQEVKARGLMISRPEIFSIAKEHDDPVTGLSQALAFKSTLYSYRMAKKWVETFDRSLSQPVQPVTMIALEVSGIPFAGAGVIPLPIAFNGSLDENLFKFNKEISSVSYTTVMVENVPHIIFACRKKDQRARAFCREMMTMERELLSAYLPQIIIGGSDTVFISKTFWENQASEVDKFIVGRAQVMRFPEMIFPQVSRMSHVEVGKRSLIK